MPNNSLVRLESDTIRPSLYGIGLLQALQFFRLYSSEPLGPTKFIVRLWQTSNYPITKHHRPSFAGDDLVVRWSNGLGASPSNIMPGYWLQFISLASLICVIKNSFWILAISLLWTWSYRMSLHCIHRETVMFSYSLVQNILGKAPRFFGCVQMVHLTMYAIDPAACDCECAEFCGCRHIINPTFVQYFMAFVTQWWACLVNCTAAELKLSSCYSYTIWKCATSQLLSHVPTRLTRAFQSRKRIFCWLALSWASAVWVSSHFILTGGPR